MRLQCQLLTRVPLLVERLCLRRSRWLENCLYIIITPRRLPSCFLQGTHFYPRHARGSSFPALGIRGRWRPWLACPTCQAGPSHPPPRVQRHVPFTVGGSRLRVSVFFRSVPVTSLCMFMHFAFCDMHRDGIFLTLSQTKIVQVQI